MKKERRNDSAPRGSLPGFDPGVAWITAAFLVSTASYVSLFFVACPDRLAKLTLVFAPELLCTSWVGGDWRRFTLLDRLPVLAATAFILAVGYAAGRLLLAAARADRGLSPLERAVFAIGVGLNALSLYTLAVGLCGGLRQTWLFVLPGATVLAGAVAYELLQRLRLSAQHVAASDVAEETSPDEGWLARYGLWLVVPFGLVMLLGGMLPPWDFDVREYHLQVPKEWYLQGQIDFLPHNVYGNMPLGAEMHAITGMALMPGQRNWWWGALVGKTVMAAFAPLTGLLLYAAGTRMFGRLAGVVAAIVFLSTPWITQVSINGLNEGASAFYWLAACYAAWLWSRNQSPGRWRLLLLAGFLAGGAVSCKYPAVLFVVLPLAGWIFASDVWRASGHRAGADAANVGTVARLGFKPLAVFLLATALGCGLWFVKNAALTGNPTYPLMYSVFDGKTRTPEKDQQWRRAHATPPYTLGELGQNLWRLGWRSEFLSPLLAPLAAMAWFGKQRRDVLLLMGFCAYVLPAWWLFTHRIDRFWVPALPLAALLAGAGAAWTTAVAWRYVLATLLALGLVLNFLIVTTPSLEGEAMGDTRYFVALDELRWDEPVSPENISRVDPAHQYLSRAVRRGEKGTLYVDCVLLVGDAQPFDLEAPALYNTCFDDCLFEKLLRNRTREERLAALRERRISYVYISWSEIARYRSPGNYGFTDWVTPELVHGELVKEQGLLRPVDVGMVFRGEVFQVVDRLERFAP